MSPWYSIQKNSSYKEVFKNGMMRIHEFGLKQRENVRYFLTKPKCAGGGATFVSASLIDTAPVLVVLLWGFGIALSILICELIVGNSNVLHNKLLSLKNRLA